MFHFRRVQWALRKLTLPVSEKSLVLDVGSGGKPYPRSDVLFDRLSGAEHRQGAPMLIDRPTVFGDACRMPFKDKSFDYVVASHILEHVANPAAFLDELQRVGKAGYIETPSFLYERLNPFNIHCLEVAEKRDVLHIYKKSQPIEDSFIANLEFLRTNKDWARLFFNSPKMFHVRLFWSDSIEYQVHNDEVSSDWIEGINQSSGSSHSNDTYIANGLSWRGVGLAILGRINELRRTKRLRDFDLFSLLCCPECRGDLEISEEYLSCEACSGNYTRFPHPDFTTKC